ncbi:ZPR1 zinc finger domain-containing protein [Candidatus Woesearchaeota archaeon]|nr:ZPR1 zinc finger domain-containing protein [Candidatus Woesearchaeota archaeon]
MEKIEGEACPFCSTKNLALVEDAVEVPYFGKVFLFSMDCANCKYHKADVECAEQLPPTRYTLDITSEEDMKIRVVKSSEATVKVPRIAEITPGPASEGYVTNVEGILQRIKTQVESLRDDEEDEDLKKKAKKMIKKIQRVMWGHESCKLIIEDPTGNSAIISEKAEKKKM